MSYNRNADRKRRLRPRRAKRLGALWIEVQRAYGAFQLAERAMLVRGDSTTRHDRTRAQVLAFQCWCRLSEKYAEERKVLVLR